MGGDARAQHVVPVKGTVGGEPFSALAKGTVGAEQHVPAASGEGESKRVAPGGSVGTVGARGAAPKGSNGRTSWDALVQEAILVPLLREALRCQEAPIQEVAPKTRTPGCWGMFQGLLKSSDSPREVRLGTANV